VSRSKPKPKVGAAGTSPGSAYLHRHGLVSVLVPVTPEVRELIGEAARASGERAVSRWAAAALEAAAREALARPAPSPPPDHPLAVEAAALREQAARLERLALE